MINSGEMACFGRDVIDAVSSFRISLLPPEQCWEMKLVGCSMVLKPLISETIISTLVFCLRDIEAAFTDLREVLGCNAINE